MPTEYIVKADHQGQMRVAATSGDLSVLMDYPLGCGALTPLELLLMSLAGCSVTSMAVLLNKTRQPFETLSVEARGQRREEHPTVFTNQRQRNLCQLNQITTCTNTTMFRNHRNDLEIHHVFNKLYHFRMHT